MSRGARLTLAIVTLLSAVGFFLTGYFLGAELPAGSWPFYGMSAFCGVIAVACLAQSSRPLTLRVIGSVIFLSYVIYAFDSFGDRDFLRALIGFVWWGLPSGYLAIWGEYPTWGKLAPAFRPDMIPRRKDSNGNE
jgi:hypothetical protein